MVQQSAAPPLRTTAIGGAPLALAGAILLAILLLAQTGVALALIAALPAPFLWPAFSAASELLLFAGLVVLAVGLRGERGVAGPSPVARGILIAGGAAPLLLQVLDSTPIGPSAGIALFAVLGYGGGVALLVGAALVARAGVLTGAARWALIPFAAVRLLHALLGSLVIVPVLVALLDPLWILAAVLLIAAGIAIAAAGRSAAIRRRVDRVRAEW